MGVESNNGRAGFILAALLFGAACGPQSDADGVQIWDTGPAEDAQSVRIHSGHYPYAPLEDGVTIPIEFGPQGGFHVLLAANVSGIETGSATLELGLQNGDLPMITWEVVAPDGMLSDEPPRRALAEAALGDGTLLAPQLVVLRYYESPPQDFATVLREQELQTMPITLNVRVEDALGATATASMGVRVDFPDRKGQIGD